jgi:hypothetical protein
VHDFTWTVSWCALPTIGITIINAKSEFGKFSVPTLTLAMTGLSHLAHPLFMLHHIDLLGLLPHLHQASLSCMI